MGYPVLKSSTSFPLIFFMQDSSVSRAAGKTGLTCTVTLSKNGAAFASPAGAVTEIGNGWYQVAGNATDTGTNGPLLLHSTGTGADPTDDQFLCVSYNALDIVRLGLTAIPNVAQGTTGSLALGDASGRPTVAGYATGQDPRTLLEVASGILDNLNTRLTAARAGYLDKLNITGNVAGSAEVTSIQNNTRMVITVPEVIERPDSGTMLYTIRFYLYDEVGNMEVPDSSPTVTLTNQAGTSVVSRLGTVSNPSSGVYQWVYTASVGDAMEQLLWEFTIVEGGVTRLIGRQSLITDNTAVDFTSTDRTSLTTIAADTVLLKTRLGTPASSTVAANVETTMASASTGVTNTTDLPSMIETASGHKRYKATALETAPTGSGGSSLTASDIANELEIAGRILNSLKNAMI